MILAPSLAVASAGLLLRRQSSTASDLWRVPDALQSDFDENYDVGEVVYLYWNGGNDSYSDLWVTAFDDEASYAQLLTRDVDLSQDGSFTWTVEVPSDDIATAASRFRLTFKASTDDVTTPEFDPTTDELPSPGFFITDDSTTSDSGNSSTPSGAPTSYSPTTTPTAMPPVVSMTGSNGQSIELSAGALIGIGVGALCALIGMGVFACLLARRCLRTRRRNRAAAAAEMAGRPQLALQTQFGPPGPGTGTVSPMRESHYLTANNSHSAVSSSSGSHWKVHEVDGRDTVEPYKYGQIPPVELDTNPARLPELGQ